MENILIDAGPLIALFNARDQYHQKAVSFLKNFKDTLWTSWPVITEASYLLNFSTKVQINLLEWINRGGLALFDLQPHHLHRLIQLCSQFQDVPVDLADATLIIASEDRQISKIATIDSDFYVYRDVRNQYLTNIFL